MPPGICLASVDEHTPQLGIALLPEFQGKGLGHPQNPAIGLYELMVATLF